MNIDNKMYIENRAELERLATKLKKRHPLTPSDKKELKALVRKIIRIVEKTKKAHPGKTGWKYLESILDTDPDLYPHLRNHVIKVAKTHGIELTIQHNNKNEFIEEIGFPSLYNEIIGHEAENIMIRVFQSELNKSNITELEKIPLKIADKIKDEIKKVKYKYEHLGIVSPIEDTEPGCISENDLGTADTELEEIDIQQIMTILKEILTLEEYEIFVLRAYEGYTSEEISELKGLSLSRVKQIYRTARAKAMKDKRIKDQRSLQLPYFYTTPIENLKC